MARKPRNPDKHYASQQCITPFSQHLIGQIFFASRRRRQNKKIAQDLIGGGIFLWEQSDAYSTASIFILTAAVNVEEVYLLIWEQPLREYVPENKRNSFLILQGSRFNIVSKNKA